jgi:hypothetical protein
MVLQPKIVFMRGPVLRNRGHHFHTPKVGNVNGEVDVEVDVEL